MGPLSPELVADQPVGARTTDARPAETERLVRDVLENLDRADQLQRVYDFDQAFAIADQVEHQVTVLESTLPPDICTEILFRLAKLEVLRADVGRMEDPKASPDYSRALELLERANQVSRPS